MGGPGGVLEVGGTERFLVVGGVDRSVGDGMGLVVLEESAVGECLRREGWRSVGSGLLVVLGVFEAGGVKECW
jgi:hypothetical protein